MKIKNFLLDEHPNFGASTVRVGNDEYKLTQVRGNGCYLSVTDLATGLERDNITYSQNDLRALYLLLCADCKK